MSDNMHRPLDQEPEIVINGVRLSRGQAMAVRVAVTDFNAQMRLHSVADAIGPLAPAYIDRTNEVLEIMLTPYENVSIATPRMAVYFNELGEAILLSPDCQLTQAQLVDLSEHVHRFKAMPEKVDRVALQEAVDSWARRLVANNHIEWDYIDSRWVQK